MTRKDYYMQPAHKKIKSLLSGRISSTKILLSALVMIFIMFSLLSKHFFSFYNIKSMLANISYISIVAGTLCLIMISGGLDISIGANIGLTTCIIAYLFNMEGHLPIGVILVIGLLSGAVVGAFNGFLITKINLNPIITTLGTMAILRGMGYLLTKGQSLLILEEVTGFIGMGEIFFIPVPLLLLIIIFIVLTLLLSRMKFGRKIYYIGANSEAARLSGININKVKFILYVLSGLAASISGIILVGQSGVGMPQHGMGEAFNAITAVLLGGTALSGGKGNMTGTLLGVLILSVLFNGFTMIGFKYVHISIFQGIILIIIVALYEVKLKKRKLSKDK